MSKIIGIMSIKSSIKVFFFLGLGAFFSLLVAQDQSDAKDEKLVFIMKISSDIDPRTNRYSELALEKAAEMDASLVILELDTYGGALNDADDIRTRVLNFEKPIYVFINKDAASAGALISLACDSIYMAKGASIGAATVVTSDGAAAPDKYQSYMRSIMRSTAEANGRDPRIAEAMVDEEIKIDSISQAGKVITLSTSEAIEYGFCEAQVESIESILERVGIEDYETFEYELGSAETVISFFMNPFISGILILIILGGIYFELQTPGVGFPILASIVALVLYLVPHYLNGLAENWEILIFFIGLVLLALEFLVIPGFGLAGIAGLVMVCGSLLLVMLNNDNLDFSFVSFDSMLTASLVLGLALVGVIFLFIFGSLKLADSPFMKKVALNEVQDSAQGFSTSSFVRSEMLGKQGVAHTVLRPSGKVMIENELFDATSRGGYIEVGEPVEVIEEEGNSLRVKKI